MFSFPLTFCDLWLVTSSSPTPRRSWFDLGLSARSATSSATSGGLQNGGYRALAQNGFNALGGLAFWWGVLRSPLHVWMFWAHEGLQSQGCGAQTHGGTATKLIVMMRFPLLRLFVGCPVAIFEYGRSGYGGRRLHSWGHWCNKMIASEYAILGSVSQVMNLTGRFP